jgi:hypothetical protein
MGSLGQPKRPSDTRHCSTLLSREIRLAIRPVGRWQVRSTLLNLGQSEILLCEQENGFAVIELEQRERMTVRSHPFHSPRKRVRVLVIVWR